MVTPPEVYANTPITATRIVTITWGGSNWGSDMAAYDVSVSMDGGTFTGWLMGSTAVSDVYPLVEGHTYTFAVSGVDNAGNLEWGNGRYCLRAGFALQNVFANN